MFCSRCGANITDGSAFCSACGSPLSSSNEPSVAPKAVPQVNPFSEQPSAQPAYVDLGNDRSPKSPSGAFVLCWFLGTFGAHDLFVGKKGLGFTKMFLTLTAIVLPFIAMSSMSMGFLAFAGIFEAVILAVFGIWTYVDMFRIGCGGYGDGLGRRLRKCVWGLVVTIIFTALVPVLGICSAVAVPKLFGQISKSKASEVATNAAAYKTIQDAYVIGMGRMGSADEIGYDVPYSSNFMYKTYSDGLVVTSNVDLNDCRRGSKWILSGKYNRYSGGITWKTKVENPYGGPAHECEVLTPGFDHLGN